ncbi:hypothetical protein ACH5RR_014656 [Cinchona calisaya]|uniref:Uncharacterized protein n=1 Tax=Cinchona calisaya TaxID=153742 RepID=A0ABD2ZUH7_9GENT
MGEKVTTMILKADLQYHSCYKKIKKILCKFPQKIRDKLCRKGGKVIKSIEIVVPPPPRKDTPQKPGPTPTVAAYLIPVGCCCVPCSEGYGGRPCYCGYGRPVPPPPCYDHYCCWYRWYGIRCDCFSEENASACTIM